MITTAIRKKFMEYPVIAAVRTPEDFEAAFHSKVKIIFMVGGDVFKCRKKIQEAKGISGVQSTRVHILKLAKQEKLVTVHRLFVTDFQALQSGLKLVHTSNPDFVELTPGILHPIVKKVSKEIPYPVISSGLIAGKDEVEKLLEEGASNIVCSDQKLWSF